VASDTRQQDRVAPAEYRARVYESARSLAAEGQLGTGPDAVLGAPIGRRDAADD
jgi:hypothetical protein